MKRTSRSIRWVAWPRRWMSLCIALISLQLAAAEAMEETITPLPRSERAGSHCQERIGFARNAGETPSRALQHRIITWLAQEYELPYASHPPRVMRVSRRQFATRYLASAYGGNDKHRERTHSFPVPSTVVAFYDDRLEIIYLPTDWTSISPADQSVLVHEMVHYLQDMANRKYACPQAREKLAYSAQEGWLAMFGRSLLADFEVDAFSLLARTECGM